MTPLLWVDGAFRTAGSEVFHASDRGATLGDGVFDTALCLGGQVVDGTAHLERLRQSVAFFGYRCAPGHLEQAYALSSHATGPAVLRVAVSRGPGTRGLGFDPEQRARIVAQLSPAPEGIRFQPVTLDVADFPRNEASPLSRHKTAGYLEAIVAMRHAQIRGAGDALFLNSKGHVACTTMANVFMILGDVLMTPGVSDGVLPGITRARILALAPSVGLSVVEGPLSLTDFGRADEVFAVNSLRLIMPIRNFGGADLRHRKALAQALLHHLRLQTSLELQAPFSTEKT
jgi:branched-chain amino acid aminotransferase